MKKASLLILFLATALLPARLSARATSGMKNGVLVDLKTNDGRQISGELIAIRGRSLLIIDGSGVSSSPTIDEARELVIRKHGKFGTGAWLGGLVGTLGGGAIAAKLARDSSRGWQGHFEAGMMGANIGGVIGLVAGGIISSNIHGRPSVIVVEGKSSAEIDAILADLRLKSRFSNYPR